MNRFAVALMCASFAVPAVAQEAAPLVVQPSLVVPVQAVARPSATGAYAALPANSEIWVSANSEVNSKKIKQGEFFDLSVSRDVVVGDYVVIPRGTRATAQISYRTGKGAFGKSAKMEFDIVNVDLKGRSIPVKGHYRIEGQGNTGATVATAVAVGVFAVFVTGRSAVVPQGQEYRAYTTDSLPITTAPTVAAMTPPVAAVAATGAPAPAATAPGAPLIPVSATQPTFVPKTN